VAGRDHHQRRRDQSRRREERLERVLSQGKKEDYARQAVIRRVTRACRQLLQGVHVKRVEDRKGIVKRVYLHRSLCDS
jgi:hypothetical protein